MFEGKNVDEMKLKDILAELEDNNWHTERCMIEAILKGDDDDINNALTVAINHRLLGYLTTEALAIRCGVYKHIEEGDDE